MNWLIGGLGVLAAIWLFARFYLRGADHSRFDEPVIPPVREAAPNPQVRQLLARFTALATPTGTEGSRFQQARSAFDKLGDGVTTDCEITSVDAGGVPAEWVVAPDGDPGIRMLYLHGGAFFVGSPRSHRRITTEFARMINGAVLAIDYRLLPENTRLDGIIDCQTAYRWILDHGPDGAAQLDRFYIAGDSAGGSLTLASIAWARDEGMRAVNAAVALSPTTDSTMGSPSLKQNVKTDLMLGPMLGPLTRVPRTLLLYGTWLTGKLRPSDPRVSPLLGDLANLPPILIQAGSHEMLVDDCRRYVNKARAAGSPVELQIWPHMPHVWHFFADDLPEAREAYDSIATFLASK